MVPDRKAPIMSASAMLGSSLHCREQAPDVPTEGLSDLLSAVLEVPWVPRALVCALEVPHKDFPQIRPTLNGVGW